MPADKVNTQAYGIIIMAMTVLGVIVNVSSIVLLCKRKRASMFHSLLKVSVCLYTLSCLGPASGLPRAYLGPASGLPRACLGPALGLPRACLGPASGLPRSCIGPASRLPRCLPRTLVCLGLSGPESTLAGHEADLRQDTFYPSLHCCNFFRFWPFTI
jgi:hypothetical protein